MKKKFLILISIIYFNYSIGINHDIKINKESLDEISKIFSNFEFKINKENLEQINNISKIFLQISNNFKEKSDMLENLNKLIEISKNCKDIKINILIDEKTLKIIENLKLNIEPNSSKISEILKITQDFGLNIIILFFSIKLINFIIENKVEIYNFISNNSKKLIKNLKKEKTQI